MAKQTIDSQNHLMVAHKIEHILSRSLSLKHTHTSF